MGQHEQAPLKLTELVIATTVENLSVTESRSSVAVSPGRGEADLSGWHRLQLASCLFLMGSTMPYATGM